MRTIAITGVETVAGPDSTALEYHFDIDGVASVLWFKVENEYAQYLTPDRCDAAVVAIIPLAVREKFDQIVSAVPISDDLSYNLRKHVIPQLAVFDGGAYRAPELVVDETPPILTASGVGTGMSMGIDSFTTISEYGHGQGRPSDRITHLTHFNVGAHHGTDRILGRGPLSGRQLYEGHVAKAKVVAQELGYPLVAVDSNLSRFLRNNFGRTKFYATHTWRNMAVVFALSRLFRRYYYSSAYNVDYFKPSLLVDTAAYEKWLLPTISTQNLRLLSSNENWTRFEKTRIVSQMPIAWDHLVVCHVGVDNCGKCDKCRKTLMTLDVLGDGALERFSSSFDLDEYKNITRSVAFRGIYRQMRREGGYGSDMKDIFEQGLVSGLEVLPRPRLEKRFRVGTVGITKSQVGVSMLPFDQAHSVGSVSAGCPLWCLGTYMDWVRVSGDGVDGYIPKSAIHIRKQEVFPDGTVARVVSPAPLSLRSEEDAPGALTVGEQVTLLRRAQTWFFVETQGRRGYVPAEALDLGGGENPVPHPVDGGSSADPVDSPDRVEDSAPLSTEGQ